MKSGLVLLFSLGLAVCLLDACGGKTQDQSSSCQPGGVKECGPSCYQQCLPSGDAYSECVCGAGGGGGQPAGGFGGEGAYPYGGAGGIPFGGGGYPVGGGGYPYGGTGGDGGYPYGGAGGYPVGGGGYPSGGSGGLPCGGCPSYKLGGLIEMKACCPVAGGCGSLVDNTIGSLLGLKSGCYPANQPGTPDPSCPPVVFTNPLDGGPSGYPGCCGSTTGTCGASVNIMSVGGPDFGCVVGIGGGGSKQCGASGGDCTTCVQNYCQAEMGQCGSTPACSAIISCASACTNQPCVDQCIATNPAGKPAFYALQSCVSAKCATQCQ